MGQNATAGKVRARNGRFLSKDKPSPPSAKQRHALGSAHETDSMKCKLVYDGYCLFCLFFLFLCAIQSHIY